MMKKQIQILLLILFISTLGFSQNCYKIIADMSGVDTIPYRTQLEAAACDLKNSFPEEFRNDFKVFDFGFYSMTEYMQGGFEAVWKNKVIPKAASESRYYLLFGKQLPDSKGKSKLWVKTNLPKEGSFNCFTTTQFNLLENTLSSIGNNKLGNGVSFYESELEILDNLKTRILSMKECCSSNFNRSVCSTCPSEEDILNYYIKNNYEESEIKIKYDGFFPVEINNPSNNLIQNYCDYLYELDDKLVDPFSTMEQSIINYNEGNLVAGVILANNSLCSDPTQTSFRASNQGATELFNSDFDISDKELVIVKHLWKNPDISKPDKLFKKYLRAKGGSLVNIDVPMNPSDVGVNSETNFNYPLTNPENCTQNTTLYEVKKDSDGKYYGYKLDNCVWIKKDIVEIGTPYPTNSDPDQYLYSQKKASATWEKKAKYTKTDNLVWVDYQKKYPCDECYDYSVGNSKNTSTEKLIQGFYNAVGTNWTSFQYERDKLFNSFIFGKGQKVVWQSNSGLSQTMLNYTDVRDKLDAIENAIKSHLLTHDNLNGLCTSNSLLTVSGPKPNLSSIMNPWMFQMFGGTQGRNIKIVKFKKINSNSCSGKYYEVQFVFELVDCFGLGMSEKWYLPGIYQQWVLQHYRNSYCCDNQSFKPVVNHKIEMTRTFYFCKP